MTAAESAQRFAAHVAASRTALARAERLDAACADFAAHRFGEAEAALDALVAAEPADLDARFMLAYVRLTRGDFARGWELFELMRARPGVQAAYGVLDAAERWDGRPFAGRRLLIAREAGFGDLLQIARFFPLVKARGGTVILECAPELATLAATFAGVDEVQVSDGITLAATSFDLVLPLMSLPGSLGIGADGIGMAAPYIGVGPERVAQVAQTLRLGSDQLNVGLVWAGNAALANDAARSAPLAALAPLFTVPGIRWFGLQTGPRALEAGPSFERLGPQLEDFAATAAVMSALDLVITTCTASAHLAGALGRPAWVLLNHLPEWRWQNDPQASPWYPSVRLFRQPAPGAWDAVADAVARALAERLDAVRGA
jgi:hypothetical protein